MTAGLPTLFWAENLLYPSGTDPWSATPTKVSPSAQTQANGWTPDVVFSAQEVNYILNQAAHLSKFAMAAQALNWSDNKIQWNTLESVTTLRCRDLQYWKSDGTDANNGVWFALVQDFDNSKIYSWQCADLQLNGSTTAGGWTQTNFTDANAHYVVSLVAPPTANGGQSPLAMCERISGGVSSYASVVMFPSCTLHLFSATHIATETFGPKCGYYVNGVFVWHGQQLTGTPQSTAFTTTNGTSFTLVDKAGGVGPAPQFVAHCNGNSAGTGWLALAFGTNTGASGNMSYLSTTDGVTFTPLTFPTQSGTNEDPKALTWAADIGIWVLITHPAADTAGLHFCYTSADGVNWTCMNSSGFGLFLISLLHCFDVAAVDGILALSYGAATTNAPALIAWSVDNGADWLTRADIVAQPADPASSHSPGGLGGTPGGRLVASGKRFVLSTELGLRVSLRGSDGGCSNL